MLLERVGKVCFGQIRPGFFFALLLMPQLLALLFLFFQSIEFKEIEESFQKSLYQGKTALQRKAAQEQFWSRYSDCDPYFLDQQIESISFLQNEQKELNVAIQHPGIVHRAPFKERLEFITSNENRLSFIEQNIRTAQNIKETEEKQRHPVELDEEDIKKLLSLIEDISIEGHPTANHSPQLLIQNFQLRRHITPIETEVFLLEMSLLKREFNP